MRDLQHTKITPVRTFAKDLEYERKLRGETSPVVLPNPISAATVPNTGAIPVPTVNVRETNLVEDIRPTVQIEIPAAKIITKPVAPASISAAVAATKVDQSREVERTKPTTIPPYHSLIQRSSHSSTKRITITDDESAATVITDKKFHRFNPFRGITVSITKWWAGIKLRRAERKTAALVVPESSGRKSIIQKATTLTARDVISESSQLRENIRLRQPATLPTASVGTGTEIVVPFVDDEPTVTVQNVRVIPRQNLSVLPPPKIEIPAGVIEPETPAQVRITTPEFEPVVVAEPEPAPTPEPRVVPSVVRTANTQPPKNRRIMSTNVLATIALLCMAITTALIFGAPYLPLEKEAPPEIAPVLDGTFLAAPSSVITRAPRTKSELFADIEIYRASSTSVREITFSDPAAPIAPANLLRLLDPQIDVTVAAAVSGIGFGFLDTKTPFIILRVTDRTNVLGGLLRWESALPQALAPLFPATATSTPIIIDRTIIKSDVRIFTTTSGSEYVVYGFGDPGTVIITTNTTAFATILELVIKAP